MSLRPLHAGAGICLRALCVGTGTGAHIAGRIQAVMAGALIDIVTPNVGEA